MTEAANLLSLSIAASEAQPVPISRSHQQDSSSWDPSRHRRMASNRSRRLSDAREAGRMAMSPPNMSALSLGDDAVSVSPIPIGKNKKRGVDHKCECCSKIYRHPSCLIKHRWEHTPHWRESSKYVLSKHQQVQLLEAAAILSHLSPREGGASLPDDRSLWPSFLSGGSLTSTSSSASPPGPRLHSYAVPPTGKFDVVGGAQSLPVGYYRDRFSSSDDDEGEGDDGEDESSEIEVDVVEDVRAVKQEVWNEEMEMDMD